MSVIPGRREAASVPIPKFASIRRDL